jgi:hypothetical protein
MVAIDYQSAILEHAAACARQLQATTDPSSRIMFHLMRQLWKALAKNRTCITSAEFTREFKALRALHEEIVGLTKPTLH